MSDSLTQRTIEGWHAVQGGHILAKDCPFLVSSSAWAAWLYGYGLGSNNQPIYSVKSVRQSRGYTLRVELTNRVDIVPFPEMR